MSYYLPMNTEADQIHRVVLEQNVYYFRYRWNTIEKAWYCYVGKSPTAFAAKFKLRCGVNLLAPFSARDGIPKGRLMCWDTEKVFGRPTRDETFQEGRFRLWYFNEGEYLSL